VSEVGFRFQRGGNIFVLGKLSAIVERDGMAVVVKLSRTLFLQPSVHIVLATNTHLLHGFCQDCNIE